MDNVYLLIGGNLGNRVENLANATELIARSAGEIKKLSKIFETAAWGITDQHSFLNQAIEIDTVLDAHALLDTILEIELALGRLRMEKNGPRLIDIDIIFYDNVVISDSKLTIPHPLLHERRFALTPLNDICPLFIHPLLGKSVNTLLAECKDTLKAEMFVAYK